MEKKRLKKLHKEILSLAVEKISLHAYNSMSCVRSEFEYSTVFLKKIFKPVFKDANPILILLTYYLNGSVHEGTTRVSHMIELGLNQLDESFTNNPVPKTITDFYDPNIITDMSENTIFTTTSEHELKNYRHQHIEVKSMNEFFKNKDILYAELKKIFTSNKLMEYINTSVCILCMAVFISDGETKDYCYGCRMNGEIERLDTLVPEECAICTDNLFPSAATSICGDRRHSVHIKCKNYMKKMSVSGLKCPTCRGNPLDIDGF